MAGIATGQIVSFNVGVPSDETENLFTHIEVFRSRSGVGGPYEEITGPEWVPATISAPAKLSVISGKQLKLRINEVTDLTITFSDPDPISPTSAASEVITQGLGLVTAYIQDGNLVLSSTQPGGAATIRVLESDAAVLLGFPFEEPTSVGFGKDARTPLIPDQSSYSLLDHHGSNDYYYKVRFVNTLENAVSDFSEAFNTATRSSIESSLLVTGLVRLVDLQGRPIPNVDVRVHVGNQTQLVGGAYLVAEAETSSLTDKNGEVSFNLPRGIEVVVSVSGTNVSRTVTTPVDAAITSFNMLDPAYGSDDAFKVQRPVIEYAVRRSL